MRSATRSSAASIPRQRSRPRPPAEATWAGPGVRARDHPTDAASPGAHPATLTRCISIQIRASRWGREGFACTVRPTPGRRRGFPPRRCGGFMDEGTGDSAMRSRRGRAAALTSAGAVLLGGLVATGAPAYADTGGVVISELNYHAGSDLDTDDFLELVNSSAEPVDVSGWAFVAGITATLPAGSVIPAGGYYVVSPDAARFSTLYGFAPDAVYTGKLSNGGEAGDPGRRLGQRRRLGHLRRRRSLAACSRRNRAVAGASRPVLRQHPARELGAQHRHGGHSEGSEQPRRHTAAAQGARGNRHAPAARSRAGRGRQRPAAAGLDRDPALQGHVRRRHRRALPRRRRQSGWCR